ncbi:DoxX family protein [Gordonia sp. ABSL1-1]|uniref:DoxX family protein n=1 Tax=Gordonia sp. ABSL1-1 TaxID=3053923 RepID=UPI00257420C3|nr:DoxX family protein [Gordonia sp. ABSL1-1]MDL9938085.1 DoxX family protein [Gordonia sp. ABSL1-1]
MKLTRREHDPNSHSRIAPLLLRGAVGGTLIAHGIKHAKSLEGTAGWFGSIGFRQPRLQAVSSAVVEVSAGTALVAGAATPVAAAAGIGTMAVAARSVHVRNGFFITAEGWEYVANLAIAAAVLAGIGPGRWSVDRALGWDRLLNGEKALAAAVGLGVGAAAAQLATFYTEPQG